MFLYSENGTFLSSDCEQLAVGDFTEERQAIVWRDSCSHWGSEGHQQELAPTCSLRSTHRPAQLASLPEAGKPPEPAVNDCHGGWGALWVAVTTSVPRHLLGSPSCPGASTKDQPLDPSPLHPGLQSHRLSPQHPFSHQQSLQMSHICWLTKVSPFPPSRCDPEALAPKILPLEGLAGPGETGSHQASCPQHTGDQGRTWTSWGHSSAHHAPQEFCDKPLVVGDGRGLWKLRNWTRCQQQKTAPTVLPGGSFSRIDAEKGGLRLRGFVCTSLTWSCIGCISQKVEMLCRVREGKFSPRARGTVSGTSQKFKG